MPQYNFRCGSCGDEFFLVCKISERSQPLKNRCILCDKKAIKRVYEANNILSADTLKCDRRMEESGVQSALERIRDNHKDADMQWKG
jgi:putative FmdB family regulatory protein